MITEVQLAKAAACVSDAAGRDTATMPVDIARALVDTVTSQRVEIKDLHADLREAGAELREMQRDLDRAELAGDRW